MTLKLGNYELWAETDTGQWYNEDQPHKWSVTFGITYLSPMEKYHRQWLREREEAIAEGLNTDDL